MKLSFDCSDAEGALYERLSLITGMPKAEIIRRAVKEYSKLRLTDIFGAEVRTILIKTYGKDLKSYAKT